MTLDINKESLELDKAAHLTLAEALDLIERDGLNKNEVITNVMVNGNNYHYETLGELLNQDIESFGEASVEIKTNFEIAFEALNDCNDYIDNINTKIKDVVIAYNDNDAETANINFATLIDSIDLFIQLISKVHRTVKSYNPDFFKNSDTIRNLEIHLLSILKALIPAKEKNDIIMLSDLLEYELADNLAQWKIKAIPLMLESKGN